MQTSTRLWLGAATVAVMALTGCGDQVTDGADPVGDEPSSTLSSDSVSTEPSVTESASESTSATPLPDCSEVWVVGEKLPLSYSGCLSDGTPVKARKYRCSYEAIIVTFDDRFYARAGRFINEVESLTSSKKFKKALAACQA